MMIASIMTNASPIFIKVVLTFRQSFFFSFIFDTRGVYSMNNFAVLIVAASLFASGPVARAEILPEKLFDIEFNPITEMSGIV
jgi:hypothetical protein